MTRRSPKFAFRSFSRLTAWLLLLTVLFSLLSCRKSEDFTDSAVKLYGGKCGAVFLYDFGSGEEEYFLGSADTVVHPASLTKLLTALAALEILPADTVIRPGDEVYLPPKGSSSAFVRPHHQLTLKMLLEGMLIPSGSDAAYAAAAACGYELASRNPSQEGGIGYEEAISLFMEYLNGYAASLGCTDTHFTVPDGFAGDEHNTTAGDLMKICAAAAENPVIAGICSVPQEDVTYASGHTNSWKNTNQMLDPRSRYYNENVCGLKTGSLKRNYSLAVLCDDGERRLLIGVCGAGKDRDRYRIAGYLLDQLTADPD